MKAAGEISGDRAAQDDDGETEKWAEGSGELPQEASGLLGNGIGVGNPILGLRNKSERRRRRRWLECGGRLGRGEAARASEKNGWKSGKLRVFTDSLPVQFKTVQSACFSEPHGQNVKSERLLKNRPLKFNMK